MYIKIFPLSGGGEGGGGFGLWRVLILVPSIYLINLLGVTTFKIVDQRRGTYRARYYLSPVPGGVRVASRNASIQILPCLLTVVCHRSPAAGLRG